MSLPERIAERTRRVKPADAFKTVLALPFYLLGWAAGAVIFVVSWVWSAAAVGFTDGRRKGHGS